MIFHCCRRFSANTFLRYVEATLFGRRLFSEKIKDACNRPTSLQGTAALSPNYLTMPVSKNKSYVDYYFKRIQFDPLTKTDTYKCSYGNTSGVKWNAGFTNLT